MKKWSAEQYAQNAAFWSKKMCKSKHLCVCLNRYKENLERHMVTCLVGACRNEGGWRETSLCIYEYSKYLYMYILKNVNVSKQCNHWIDDFKIKIENSYVETDNWHQKNGLNCTKWAFTAVLDYT